ncbi:MAG: asparaginase [Nocardioidaceae bacterium]
MSRTTIHLIATGGTIACLPDPDGPGLRPQLSADDLAALALDGGGVSDTTIKAWDAATVSGWDMTLRTMQCLSGLVARAVAQGTDGVVVTHGTDSLEETAVFLDIAAAAPVPVIVTGAMRHPTATGSDAAANLRDAVAVARDPGARGRGALVVFDGHVWRASGARKAHSERLDAFTDVAAGPLADVLTDGEGRRVLWWSPPTRFATLDVTSAVGDVVVVEASPGQDARFLAALLEADPDGLVLAGLGMGHIPGAWVPLLADAVTDGLPVLMTTRVGNGPVGPQYGGPGGGFDVAAIGVLACGHRTAQRARVELTCALGAGLTATAAARWVANREQPVPAS